MRLNINSPAFFSQNYGIDDDVYELCKKIKLFMKDREYSEIVDTIGITPLVVPQEILNDNKWRQIIKYDLKYRMVIISKHIDFKEYLNADSKQRKILILQNILNSVKTIHKKSKIDYVKFEEDLMNFIRENNLVDFQ